MNLFIVNKSWFALFGVRFSMCALNVIGTASITVGIQSKLVLTAWSADWSHWNEKTNLNPANQNFLMVPYSQLFVRHSEPPSDSCSGDERRLFHRKADRSRSVPPSEYRWCTRRTDYRTRDGRTPEPHAVRDMRGRPITEPLHSLKNPREIH